MGRRPSKVKDANISLDAKIIGFADGYKLNDRFDIRKVSVVSWEDVANRFHFSKDVIDKSDYQLDMLPVVGYHDGYGFTSHDEKVVPYGAVIPKSARWENVDGKEYKVVDVAFWKSRYKEQLKDIDECNQSIEAIDISGIYNKEMGVFEVDSFTYDALCVLNQNVQPAFPNAKVFNLSDIKDEFDIFKKEFNDLFNDSKTEKGVDPVENTEINENAATDVNETNNAETKIEETHENTEATASENMEEETEEMKKKHAKCEESPSEENVADAPDKEQTNAEDANYQELYETLQTSFSELTENYSNLVLEVESLRQFKLDTEEVQAKEKAEMELQAKTTEVEKFASKLSKKEINETIDDVNNFSLEEIRTRLSVMLANKLLSENETFNKDNTIVNIDNTDKTYSRSERLLAELKSKRKY